MFRARILTNVAAIGAGLFLDSRSDVAIALSLRRVRNAYQGALVRVRRSSDSTEQDFASGQPAVNWSEVQTFIGAGSGFVSKWYDQSGNTRDLAQSTAASQPRIILAANGVTAALFDGVDDSLVTATFTLNQPNTFNIIYRRLTNAQASLQNVFDGVTGDTNTLFGGLGGAENRLYAGSTGPTSDVGTSMPIGTRGAVGGTFNGASSLLEVNAATIASFSGDASTNAADGVTLGGRGGGLSTRFDNIEVQELVRFNTAHTSVQLKADNAAMRAAWGF